MKAIKIDVAKRTFEQIEVSNWEEYAGLIGNGCRNFAVPIVFDNNDAIFIDDEGLYNDIQGGIIMDGWSYPLVGNALIVGGDDEGGSADVKTTIDELKAKIKFVSKDDCISWSIKALNTPPTIISW